MVTTVKGRACVGLSLGVTRSCLPKQQGFLNHNPSCSCKQMTLLFPREKLSSFPRSSAWQGNESGVSCGVMRHAECQPSPPEAALTLHFRCSSLYFSFILRCISVLQTLITEVALWSQRMKGSQKIM